MSNVASESPFLVRNFRNEGTKKKIRNPNIEIRNKSEYRNPKSRKSCWFSSSDFNSSLFPSFPMRIGFSSSDFEFVSDFEIRISDFHSSLFPHSY